MRRSANIILAALDHRPLLVPEVPHISTCDTRPHTANMAQMEQLIADRLLTAADKSPLLHGAGERSLSHRTAQGWLLLG